MEEERKQSKLSNEQNLAIAIGGAFVLGIILGRSGASKQINEAYNKGVMDSFQSIVFRSVNK